MAVSRTFYDDLSKTIKLGQAHGRKHNHEFEVIDRNNKHAVVYTEINYVALPPSFEPGGMILLPLKNITNPCKEIPMNIKQILETKGWKKDSIYIGRRQSSILRHPTLPHLFYAIQSHEFRTKLRTIARISSRNVVYDKVNDLIIIDDFIAIKA